MAGAFLYSRPFVTASIIGATSIPQLETALAAAAFEWTPELDAAVDDLHQRTGNPCP